MSLVEMRAVSRSYKAGDNEVLALDKADLDIEEGDLIVILGPSGAGKRPVYGNALYEIVLRQVISDAMDVLPCKDVNVLLDSCRFITIGRLKDIVHDEAIKHNVNVKIINKVNSEQNKCIQLVDFIAGASRALYENNDNTINNVRDKISVARRH